MQVLFGLFLADERNTVAEVDRCGSIGKAPCRTGICAFGIILLVQLVPFSRMPALYRLLLCFYIYIDIGVVISCWRPLMKFSLA